MAGQFYCVYKIDTSEFRPWKVNNSEINLYIGNGLAVEYVTHF